MELFIITQNIEHFSNAIYLYNFQNFNLFVKNDLKVILKKDFTKAKWTKYCRGIQFSNLEDKLRNICYPL